MTRFTLFFFSGLLFCAAVAQAGVVRVVTGPNSFGQGYMFLDQDGVCKVATAGHVVKLADGGVVARITIVDEKGRTPELGAPIVLTSEPDLAVLPVIGANDPAVCGDGRLSAIGIARRIKETTSARIETTDGSGVVRVPVRWRAAAQDADGGSIFTVTPANADDRIVKGWSGSVVLDNDGLLGIVFEVDPASNEAYAVRADRIRELVDAARPQARTATQNMLTAAPVVSLAGTTPDPSHGPNDIYRAGDAAWNVVPAQGKISFLVTFTSSIHLRGVALTYASEQNVVVGVEVAASAAPGSQDWTSLNYCPIAAGDRSIRCNVVTSTVSRVRVTLKTNSDNALMLSGLSILQQSDQASASNCSNQAYDSAAKVSPASVACSSKNEAGSISDLNKVDATAAAAGKVIAADPAMAISYYLKGQELIQKATVDPTTGKLILPPGCVDAYQKYLELAPTGKYAQEVKGILALVAQAHK